MIKKLLTFFAVLAMCVSCYDDSKIWDTLTDHENRISELEKLCKEMNTNISSLQGMVQSLQQNEYITNVIAVVENGKEVGYSFTFSSGKTVVVYHGKDGQDGTDGKDGSNGTDGYTPVIGVAEEGGVYYWTIDGNWVLDNQGSKVPASGKDGANGTDGINGANGSDGKDGITPQLKIVDGYWYISYDNGTSWEQLGQATGDQGPQGAPGVDSDSMFADIDFSTSSEYVVLVLNNGVQIKLPTWLAFETLKEQCEKMNTNIASLQTVIAALESNDYVTSVTPLYEGVLEIGYKINFSKSGSITIYHGKDGKDGTDGKDGQDGANGTDGTNGADGKDGVIPVIGVAQENGVYYWTVNGSWLLDASGNKVPTTGNDGAPGQDGNPGESGIDGTDGKDGVTPQLKIENGNWFVSYDNGASWTELGQATGDQGPQGETGATGPQGPQGNPGISGDSMFSNVDYSNSEYVIFVLGNGTEIKVPTLSAFEALKTLVNQINTNVEALQTIVGALENNDYVTGVTPLYDGTEEIGYKINFSKSGSVTIYHGKDGKDGVDGAPGQDGSNGTNGTNGADGKDGVTPVIGVAQENGVYYWTVNGSWLLDASGNKVPTTGNDGAPGQDGANGSNGTNGKDGVTPQFMIQDGDWYVSYDNGLNWIHVGQATGDQGPQGETGATGSQGPQGNPGISGDSMFSNVDCSNSEYVTFVLGDGTEIKVPTWAAFEALQQECQRMNSNIAALQTVVDALANNDYVTGVTSIYEDGAEVGYRINFSKSGSIVIYHGKNGADGYVPVISASPVNGYYYWTLDGNWMLDSNGSMIPATGPTGFTPQFMIQDGSWYVSYDNGMNWNYVGQATGNPGADGNPGGSGIDGTDGKDGITPQFMIQNGDWYVSYDNGMNWNYVGQATGNQGPQGNQGNPGDSMFSFIDYYSSSDYVTFYLSNGSVIQLPTLSAFQNQQAQCNRNNQNISSLQSIVEALQCKDYIESINPIYDDNWNHIGYEMCFSQSGWITIYHGQNGAQGHSPAIGVGLYDGRFYWTIDGSWLYDDYGNMIPTTGQDGQNGTSGENGITPQLKIENGYWYVSYDNAVTWKKLDKATGADGNDGDAFFKSVTENEKYVTMTLVNGTEIRVPRFEEPAATIALKKVAGNSAIFEGQINKTSPDLKVTVYYSTYSNLSIYKNSGSVSLVEFLDSDFTLRINGLVEKTQYYYFTEVVFKGVKTYSEISSFVTGESDSYIDWENGENVEGEI